MKPTTLVLFTILAISASFAETISGAETVSYPTDTVDTYPEIKHLPGTVIPESLVGSIQKNPVFDLLITEKGNVDSIYLVQSCGNRIIDSLATGSLQSALFTPAVKGGQNVAVLLRFKFTLVNKTVGDTTTIDPDSVAVPTDEIIVYGSRSSGSPQKQTLRRIEFSRYPGYNGDAIKMLEIMPSASQTVASTGIMTSALCIRGGGPDDSRYFIDGIPLQRLYHLNGLISAYNTEGLSKVNFFPGNYGVRYGGSISGVVDLETEDSIYTKKSGYGELNLIDGAAVIKTPLTKNSSLFFSARRSWLGDVLGWLTAGSTGEEEMRLYFWDINAKYSLRLNDKNRISCSFLYANNLIHETVRGRRYMRPYDSAWYYLVNPANFADSSTYLNAFSHLTEVDTFTTTNLHLIQQFLTPAVEWSCRPNPRVNNTLTVAALPCNSSVTNFDTLYSKSSTNGYFLRDELSLKGALADYVLGADCWLTKITSHAIAGYNPAGNIDLQDSVGKFQRTQNRRGLLAGLAGGYFQAVLFPQKRWNLIPGARFDYFPRLSGNGNLLPVFTPEQTLHLRTRYPLETSLHLTGKYRPADNMAIHASFGNYNKDYDPFYFQNTVPAKATHYSGGFEWLAGNVFSCELAAYYENQWALQEYRIALTDYNANVAGVRFDGKGRMGGIELFCKYSRSDSTLAVLSYSLSKSERWEFDRGEFVPYEKDRRHNLKAAASFFLPRQFTLGSGIRFSSGAPKYPVIDEVYYENKGYFDLICYRLGNKRYKPYIALDFKIAQRFWKKQCEWSLDLKNLNALFYASTEINRAQLRYDDIKKVWEVDPDEYYDEKQILIPVIGIKVFF